MILTSLQVCLVEADVLTYDLEGCLDRMIQKQGCGTTHCMLCDKLHYCLRVR